MPYDRQITIDKGSSQKDDRQKIGKGVEQVRYSHHDVVQRPSAQSSRTADEEADRKHDDLNAEPDLKRDKRAFEDPRPGITPQIIGTEEIVTRGALLDMRVVLR